MVGRYNRRRRWRSRPFPTMKYVVLVLVLTSLVTAETLFCKFCPSGSLLASIPATCRTRDSHGLFFYVHTAVLLVVALMASSWTASGAGTYGPWAPFTGPSIGSPSCPCASNKQGVTGAWPVSVTVQPGYGGCPRWASRPIAPYAECARTSVLEGNKVRLSFKTALALRRGSTEAIKIQRGLGLC